MTEYSQFVDWLASNNWTLHGDITIDERNSVRGLYTNSDIPINTTLCTIPSTLVLYEQNTVLQPFIDIGLPDYVQLISWLCEQYTLGNASQYYQWIQLLPISDTKYSILQQRMHLTELVENTTLQAALVNRMDDLHTLYTQLYEYYCNTDDTNGTDHWFSKVTFDMFCAADYTIWSRCIGLPDENEQQQYLAFIPYIDMINHTNDTTKLNCRWEFNHNDQSVSLLTTQSISANSELYITYGNKSNTELLYLYMFAIDNNVYDDVVITLNMQELLQNKSHEIILSIIQLMKQLQLSAKIQIESDVEFNMTSWILACILSCTSIDQLQSIQDIYNQQHTNNNSDVKTDTNIAADTIEYNHTIALKQFDISILAQGKQYLVSTLKQYRSTLPDTSTYDTDDTLQKYAVYYITGQRRICEQCLKQYTATSDVV